MKGVVLAGGTGSRLAPLTDVTNKHLLPVGAYPMVFHPIDLLARAGVRDILVVTGADHVGDFAAVLGSGRRYGLEITFRAQDRPGGIAEALGLAEGFAAGSRIAVVLGDNVFGGDLTAHIAEFREGPGGAMVFLTAVGEPERFGIARLDGAKIVEIVEKPTSPIGDLAVTGLYLYDEDVFDIVRSIDRSERGELEITDVNRAYLDKASLSHRILDGWWVDAGVPETLAEANRLLADARLVTFS